MPTFTAFLNLIKPAGSENIDVDQINDNMDDIDAQFAVDDGRIDAIEPAGLAASSAWSSYTPTLGGWTLSNGTIDARFKQIGKTVFGLIVYTVGSSDTKSGAPTFTMPVAAHSSVIAGTSIGVVGLFDTSANARAFRHTLYSTAGGGTLAAVSETDIRLSPTVPWTWATGDQMMFQFMYEAA